MIYCSFRVTIHRLWSGPQHNVLVNPVAQSRRHSLCSFDEEATMLPTMPSPRTWLYENAKSPYLSTRRGGSSERVCVCFTNVHAHVCLSDTLLSGQSPSRQCLSWAAVPMESAIVAAHLIFLGDRRSGGCGRRRTTKIGDPNRRGAIGLRRSTAVVVEFDACGSLSDKQQAWLVSRGPGPRTSRLLCHDAPPADGVSPLRDLRSGEAGETPFNSGCSRRLDVVNGCNI